MRLTVKHLKNRDPGSGMAVIDREALGEIDAGSDDSRQSDLTAEAT